MVQACREAFDKVLGDKPNQLDRLREDVHVTADQLLDVRSTPGEVTEEGLRNNISVGIQYLESWLRGSGAVGINNLMEDAATAEISRSQVWQWIRSPKGTLDAGRKVTKALVATLLPEEMAKIRDLLGAAYGEGRYDDAARIFADLVNNDTFVDFLTLPAYELVD